MRASRVRKRWSEGRPAFATQVKSSDPVVTEIISRMGVDSIWIDLEHNHKSVETLTELTRAARHGCSDIMARPAKEEFMRMGRLLEAGAHGILYPRCESAEEAREVIRWSKFAPLGERGFDGGNADNQYGATPMPQYIVEANRETWIAVQIESPVAVEKVDEIAQVEGVDILFFGPGDFSVLAGIPGQFDHPKFVEAVETVASACHRHGKVFGTLIFSLEMSKWVLDLGAKFVVHGVDVGFMTQGYLQLQKDYKEMGHTFFDQG